MEGKTIKVELCLVLPIKFIRINKFADWILDHLCGFRLERGNLEQIFIIVF